MRDTDDDAGSPTLYGHAAVGCVFASVAFLWTIRFSLTSYGRSVRGSPRDRETHHPGSGTILLEGLVWFGCGSSIIVQVFANEYFQFSILNRDGDFDKDSLVGWQHVCLSLPWVAHGALIIAVQTVFPKLDVFLPRTGVIASSLMFAVTYLHAYGGSALHDQAHVLISVPASAIAVLYIAELFCGDPEHTQTLFIWKTFFMMLFGTWWMQVGFIIDPPSGVPWESESEMNLILVKSAFVWHAIVDMTLIFIIYSAINVMLTLTAVRPAQYMSMRLLPHQEKTLN